MIKTLLIDWDGTLVHSLPMWLKICQEIFEEFGLHFSEKKFKQSFFDSHNCIKELAGDKYKEINKTLFDRVNEEMKQITIEREILESLRILSEMDVNLILASSSSRLTINQVLINNEIDHLFSKIFGFEDVENGKPNPEIIFKAMEFCEDKQDEIMILGDSDNDIEAGRQAGIQTCFYYPKENQEFYNLTKETLDNMGLKISSFSEIVNIV